MKIGDFYNNLYGERGQVFGPRPALLIEKLAVYVQGKVVVDFGAGNGRNSLFLARNGARVSALDVSSVGLEKLKESVKKENLDITTKVLDVRYDKLPQDYEIGVCTFVFHHLAKDEMLALVVSIQEGTKIDGLNSIAGFMDEGNIYDASERGYFLQHEELRNLYKGWEIVEYEEEWVNTLARLTNNASRGRNMGAAVIARKIF